MPISAIEAAATPASFPRDRRTGAFARSGSSSLKTASNTRGSTGRGRPQAPHLASAVSLLPRHNLPARVESPALPTRRPASRIAFGGLQRGTKRMVTWCGLLDCGLWSFLQAYQDLIVGVGGVAVGIGGIVAA